jgi:tetratricopeptide (TPR) repeat protein
MRGEVFVEVAPGPAGKTANAFVVQTPQRLLSARGTRFVVRVNGSGTGVVVTQGKVHLGGSDSVLSAGQELRPGGGGKDVHPARRVSHLLAWTRELMAARGRLVSRKFDGGALIAHDPEGRETALQLRRFHIDVHVEDGFARTAIDQTYFNHDAVQREGTFIFPLPPDASVSRLAMYVDGKFREGGMAERKHARTVYETIRYTRRDPALLEWVDGSTFRMRVFPLEQRQEKRITLCYTQKLPSLYGHTRYRFPAGHSLESAGQWSFRARIKRGKNLHCTSASHRLVSHVEGADLIVEARGKDVKSDRDVVLVITDPRHPVANMGQARFACCVQNDRHGQPEARYLMVRYRPLLALKKKRQRRDWVFLFESSGDRDPLLARAQVEVVRGLLANAEHDDTFTLISANTRVRTFAPKAQPATAGNIAVALLFLEKSHLIGALDLDKGLRRAVALAQSARNPYLVHIGSGLAGLGERQPHLLARNLPRHVRYVGVGVGKRWGSGFMKAAADRTGGYFTQMNPDEPIAWRAFDLMATLNTPRILDLQVVGGPGKTAFLSYPTAVAQGEECCAVARFGPGRQDLPKSVVITGRLGGKPVRYRADVTLPVNAGNSEYLPRTWARLEIDRLLASGAKKYKDRIIELSKQMFVMSPFTSLLVLEDDRMHRQFKVGQGRKDHWAPYVSPQHLPATPAPPEKGNAGRRLAPQRRSVEQVLKTILVRVPPRVVAWDNPWHDFFVTGQPYLTALDLYSGAFAVPLPGAGVPLDEPVIQPLFPVRDGKQESQFADRAIAALRKRLAKLLGPGRLSARELTRFWEMFEDRETLAAALRDPTVTRLFPGHKDSALGMSGGFGGLAGVGGGLAGIGGLGGLPGGGRWGGIGGFGGLPRMLVSPPSPRGIGGLPVDDEGEGEVPVVVDPSSLPAPEPPGDNVKVAALAGELAELTGWLQTGAVCRTMPYRRLAVGDHRRLFDDLLGYAPGMNTTRADILAVLEAEAVPDPEAKPGKIDPAARALIERARRTGWRAVRLPDGVRIIWDGRGRYVYERFISGGLRERVVCDGQHLWHLYPELAVGACRTVSRFHRAAFARLVPWVLPPANDLTRGADLKRIARWKVAVIPRGGRAESRTQTHLVFAADGRLRERRLVAMPARQILSRETFRGGEWVRRVTREGKTRIVGRLAWRRAIVPDLRPNMKGLVVVPLPYRTPKYFEQSLPPDWEREDEDLDEATALGWMMAANLVGQSDRARYLLSERFHLRNDRRLGFFTLLLATTSPGGDRNDLDPFDETLNADNYPGRPLSKYLEFECDRWPKPSLDTMPPINGPPDGFLQQLARFRNLTCDWFRSLEEGPGPWAQIKARKERTTAFLRQCQSPLFRWLLLDVVQRVYHGKDGAFLRTLADHYGRLRHTPGLSYPARYEEARLTAKSEDTVRARKLFQQAVAGALGAGRVPRIDGDFRRAFRSQGKDRGKLGSLLEQAAVTLCAAGRRPAVIGLAWQCEALGEAALARRLVKLAFAGAAARQRPVMSLMAVLYLGYMRQYARAEAFLRPLLTGPLAGDAAAWRLAAQFADKRGNVLRSTAYLEKALTIEYQAPQQILTLLEVRLDYGLLLEGYRRQVLAAKLLGKPLPSGFRARVVKAADRWRSLDPAGSSACLAAGRVFLAAGAQRLAWDYLTTAVGRADEEVSWSLLAHLLARGGAYGLADRAFRQAVAADPTNPEILWTWAMFLKQVGNINRAQRLIRRIAVGKWQVQYQYIQQRARQYLRGPAPKDPPGSA